MERDCRVWVVPVALAADVRSSCGTHSASGIGLSQGRCYWTACRTRLNIRAGYGSRTGPPLLRTFSHRFSFFFLLSATQYGFAPHLSPRSSTSGFALTIHMIPRPFLCFRLASLISCEPDAYSETSAGLALPFRWRWPCRRPSTSLDGISKLGCRFQPRSSGNA
ncbi:hypothetical protein C8R43DRAFT_448888 [Mycena crocata]|nr:hypothetical protein C8R43DRAFT_448888 [Mycena crocata]